jgi:hypothetical protein
MAEGVGSAPTSVLTDPVFETGAASLYLPAFHKLACRAEAHRAKAGCQGWTRTNTERLNRPPCYFDTTWQWLIGAAGRSCTCISSFRRRTPRLFRPRQQKKWSNGLWSNGSMAVGQAASELGTQHSSTPTPQSEIGQRGRNCTCDPSVPSRVRWLLRYALSAPAN